MKCFFFQSPFSLEHNDAAVTSGSPNSVEVCWNFEFIGEYMKINKTRSKFHFLTKIKMTPCVFVFFTVSSLLDHLEAVLWTFKILSCTNNKK